MTRGAGATSGASRAELVPAARRADPSRSASHAATRSASGTPESSRTTWPSLARRCAQRAAVSMSAAITSTAPGAASMRSSARFSRPAPTSSSGRPPGLALTSDAVRVAASAARRGAASGVRFVVGGGRSAAQVEPTDERL